MRNHVRDFKVDPEVLWKEPIKVPKRDIGKILTYGFWTVFISVLTIALFISQKFEAQHPIVCTKEKTIKQIIAISGSYASVRLNDDSVISYAVRVGHGGKSGYTYRTVDVGQTICLERARQ